MKPCPRCGRRPSERIGILRNSFEANSPIAVAGPICDGPLHDAADKVGELLELSRRARDARLRLERVATEKPGSIAHRQADDTAQSAGHELLEAAGRLA